MCLVGEAVLASDIKTWSNALTLYVGYGCTECTMCTTFGRLEQEARGPPSIGCPVNGSCWVAHPADQNQLVPIGAVGELIIGGPIVSRGYIERPNETAAAFIQNPAWAADIGIPPDQRFYKTGDLVQYGWDGSLHFIGRKDAQVKLHGQRIELEEIEQCVHEFKPDITRVAGVVQFTDTPGKTLVLFVYSTEPVRAAEGIQPMQPHELFLPSTQLDLQLSLSEIQEHLARILPSFMTPSVLIYLRHLPLSSSGKTNRRLLCELAAKADRKTFNSGATHPQSTAEPSTDRERLVRSVFAHVLSKEESEIGIHDSFFALGDSISAMQSLNLCRQEGLHLTMPEFLVNNTVHLVSSTAQIKPKVSPRKYTEQVGEVFSLSPIQSLFCALVPSLHSRFNQSFFVEVTKYFDISQWDRALEHIVDHHAMLRMRLQSQHEQMITPGVKGSFALSIHHVQLTECINGSGPSAV